MFYFRFTIGDYAGLDTLLILYLLSVKDHIPSLKQWRNRVFYFSYGGTYEDNRQTMGPKKTKKKTRTTLPAAPLQNIVEI